VARKLGPCGGAERRLGIDTGTVRVRPAHVERSPGELALGPSKSKAGKRIVGIPQAIIPALKDHLRLYVKPEAGALIFAGIRGRPYAAERVRQRRVCGGCSGDGVRHVRLR
jgi:hypothetical protein